jgi:hypothetical protein
LDDRFALKRCWDVFVNGTIIWSSINENEKKIRRKVEIGN